ncbi:zinc finger and SCAN domain-containing protein 9-like [Elgaria multicarinata webbii]|uniref:zinc finger and SCAN domain-containing protein 9-like n=1 Tax=Elgaria multicarinata webbii TaxID=159646 RepID=UPI002FCD12C6
MPRKRTRKLLYTSEAKRKREARAKETEEQRNTRRAADAARKAKRRAAESQEERLGRLAADSVRRARRRASQRLQAEKPLKSATGPKTRRRNESEELQLAIRTEEQGPTGGEPELRTEGRRGDAPFLQAGTSRELLIGAASQQIKQEPSEGLWEGQRQESPTATQASQSGGRQPMTSEGTNGHEAFKKRDDVSSHRVYQETCEAQGGAVKVRDNRTVSLDFWRQHFRHLFYQEAEGPEDTCRHLQELCCLWLKPERNTKERMLELLVLEQFLANLPQEMQSWVRKGGPDACVEAVALAEEFLMRQHEPEKQKQKEAFGDVSSSEQDPSDIAKMQLSKETEKASVFVSDGQMKEDEEETFHLEKIEQVDASGILLDERKTFLAPQAKESPRNQHGTESYQEQIQPGLTGE